MISLLVTLLVIAVVIYVATLVMGMLPIPAPLKTICYLILGLIAFFVLLDALGWYHFALK